MLVVFQVYDTWSSKLWAVPIDCAHLYVVRSTYTTYTFERKPGRLQQHSGDSEGTRSDSVGIQAAAAASITQTHRHRHGYRPKLEGYAT